jgi:predicted heme/steroid binding protein
MENAPNQAEQLFSELELRRFDGEDGPMYIAYKGIVYDVSNCPRWRTGLHENMHFPGQDLSGEIVEAPHQEEVFQRPCIKIVGRMRS